MFHHLSLHVLTALLLRLCLCDAALFSSTPTAIGTSWHTNSINNAAAFHPTAAPDLRDARGLTKRDNPSYHCGSGTAIGSIECLDHHRQCQGSIFPNERAYVFCADPSLVSQSVATTAYGHWPLNETCPLSAWCCSGESPYPQTYFYTASGYTMTGFVCSTIATTYTMIPASNVLDPSSFSISLAQARGSTSGTTSTTSTPTHTSNSDSGGGLSTGTKIGIGAGAGIGVAAAVVLGAVYLFSRHQRKKTDRQKTEAAALSPSQGPPFDMRSSYGGGAGGQPPDYNSMAYKHYHSLSRSSAGSYNVVQPQEMQAGAIPQELPGSPGGSRR